VEQQISNPDDVNEFPNQWTVTWLNIDGLRDAEFLMAVARCMQCSLPGSDLTDVYLSSLNHRTNEIIKVLTIIATLLMPLTFVAGLYGMNFNTGIYLLGTCPS
jgi:Mg2+ and Co2+ transporter CorA